MNIGGYEFSYITTKRILYDNEKGLIMECLACAKDDGKEHTFQIAIPPKDIIESLKKSFDEKSIPIEYKSPYNYCDHDWVNHYGVTWCRKCGALDTKHYHTNSEGYIVRDHIIFYPESSKIHIGGDADYGPV